MRGKIIATAASNKIMRFMRWSTGVGAIEQAERAAWFNCSLLPGHQGM